MGRPKKNGHANGANGHAVEAINGDADEFDRDDAHQEAAEVAIGTLTGDLRDFILDRLRHEQDKRPWHLRSEADQRDTVHQVETHVRGMVRQAVELIASSGRRTVSATLESVVIKEGIKATLSLERFDQQRHALSDAVGHAVLIVVADPDAFTGERAPATIRPDQGDLVRDATMAVHSEANGAPATPLS